MRSNISCPLPKKPTPAFGLSGLGFGPKLRPPPGDKISPPKNKFGLTSLRRCTRQVTT